MKKLLISILTITSLNYYCQDTIRCAPNIKSCIENLKKLESWVWNDLQEDKLSNKIHDEYHLVIVNTIAGLEMFIDDKGQCDMNKEAEEIKYWSK